MYRQTNMLPPSSHHTTIFRQICCHHQVITPQYSDKYAAIIKSSHHNIQTNMLPSSSHHTAIFKISHHSYFSLKVNTTVKWEKIILGKCLKFIQLFTKWHLFISNIMGRFWNMLATAVLGGAKTEINQVLRASKLQTNISIKLLIEINPAIRD